MIRADAASRLAAAAAFAGEACEGNEPLAILAPTRHAADVLVRDLVRSRGAGCWGIRRSTPLQRAAELALPRLASRGLAPLRGLSHQALAARALAACAPGLGPLGPVARMPGTARALARTLRELRLAATRPEALEALGDAERDLGRLLGCYAGLLEQNGLADDADLFRHALEALGESADAADAGGTGSPLLLLDLAPRHALEGAFLRALVSRAPAALATLPAGDPEAENLLADAFPGARPTDLGELPDFYPEAQGGAARHRLERLRRQIFAPALDRRPMDDPSLELFAAPGEGRECVEIARRLQGEADRVPFDDTAIALRNPELYFPLIEEALARAGIPCHFSQGARRPDPAGRALLALLACAGERLSASRFAEYLSLGQLPPLDAAGAPPVVTVPWVEARGDQLVLGAAVPDPPPPARPAGRVAAPRRWEHLLVDAAVIAGADRWRRRLDGVDNELRLQQRNLDDDDDSLRRRLDDQLGELDRLRRFALPLIEELDALPGRAPWREWLERLEKLAARALRDPGRLLETLAELRPLDGSGEVGLDEVRRVLEERLTLLRQPPRERSAGKVFVGTPDELRGLSFHTVYVPGLAEGLFPRRVLEDPLLLDDARRLLAEGPEGAALPRADQRVARERLLLRLAIGAARERLVASYPNLDTLAGRARVPSFYALDLLRAADGQLPDLRMLEQSAAGASAALLGWPAPRDPEEAVDDAEFDIAMLAELGRLNDEEGRGQARFLLDTNPRLHRSLRNRYSRFTSRKLGRSDGLLAPEGDAASHAALARHRLANRPYSPTALQNYAVCPLRFFYQAILGLRPRDQARRLQQLDPLTRGALFHETQFHLQQALQSAGLLPVRPDGLERAAKLADACLDRVAAQYAEELAPAIPRVFAGEIAALRVDLRAWLHALAAAPEPYVPVHFELSFGLAGDHGADPHHDPASRPEPVAIELEDASGRLALARALLRGSIDLVEESSREGAMRVTDHKTGASPKPGGSAGRPGSVLIGGGELLQPLLYALAAEGLLERKVVGGRLFYCTRRGGQKVLEAELDDRGRAAIHQVFATIDGAIEKACLPALPRKDACARCDYRIICGPLEEQRIRGKNRDKAAALDELRRRP